MQTRVQKKPIKGLKISQPSHWHSILGSFYQQNNFLSQFYMRIIKTQDYFVHVRKNNEKSSFLLTLFSGEDPAYLIFSNRHEMRRLDIAKEDYVSLVSGLPNTIALDFHYEKKMLFWTDVVDDQISRGTMISNSKFWCFHLFWMSCHFWGRCCQCFSKWCSCMNN